MHSYFMLHYCSEVRHVIISWNFYIAGILHKTINSVEISVTVILAFVITLIEMHYSLFHIIINNQPFVVPFQRTQNEKEVDSP